MDQELLDAGYRAYTGEKIDVYFNMQTLGQLRARQREAVRSEA